MCSKIFYFSYVVDINVVDSTVYEVLYFLKILLLNKIFE
jgi:hypothetical protein